MRELERGCSLAQLVWGPCLHRERWEPPASYVVIGSVAVVSLSRGRGLDEARRYARDILEHAPGVEAVYAKLETAGEHRAQRLVHLAGRKVEETVYVEHGLRFPVRLGRVYVNPRLATEHRRIASQARPGERVLDMFAGIGGFSLLLASTGKPSLVVANDVNPYAVEAMSRAVELNKSRIRSRLVIMMSDALLLPTLLKPVFDRVIMNLPHNAKQFLPVARRLCSPRGCIVHLYTVAQSPGEAVEGLPGWAAPTAARRVLDYAPGKSIYRVDLLVTPLRLVGDEEGEAPGEPAGEAPPKPRGQGAGRVAGPD